MCILPATEGTKDSVKEVPEGNGHAERGFIYLVREIENVEWRK